MAPLMRSAAAVDGVLSSAPSELHAANPLANSSTHGQLTLTALQMTNGRVDDPISIFWPCTNTNRGSVAKETRPPPRRRTSQRLGQLGPFFPEFDCAYLVVRAKMMGGCAHISSDPVIATVTVHRRPARQITACSLSGVKDDEMLVLLTQSALSVPSCGDNTEEGGSGSFTSSSSFSFSKGEKSSDTDSGPTLTPRVGGITLL
ncbi:hypothetical protein BKA56DRAFT_648934 [Ilyonectria sp. MPI-CAGE-AT-0026]|nr:hypothetical protein BKA56DRAFT_648934 [Ilyonectria sp. MPI-CAGE-AT-0026]